MYKFISVCLLIGIFTTPCLAGKTLKEVLADPEIGKVTGEERLAIINKLIEEKTIKSYDISSDIIARFFWVVLVKEKDPTAQMERYAGLRAKYTKLGSTYALEQELILNYLATNPEAVKAEPLDQIKMIQKMQDDKKVSWPTVAPIHNGMLCRFLLNNKEYQQMSPIDKIKYLKKLGDDKVCSNLTTTKFSKPIAMQFLANTPAAEQAAKAKEIGDMTDFFTRSAITTAFVEK